MKQIFLDAAAGRDNPSALHREGVLAAQKLEQARARVAAVLSCRPDEIIFTSGGTEANNLAIFGLAQNVKHSVFNILTTELEHASVLEPAKQFPHTKRRDIELVSVIYAHNEIGVIQPIREIAKVIRKFRQQNNSRTPYFHTDACQAPSFLDLNVQKLGVDLMTLNGGKLGVPGAGLLFVRRGVPLKPIILGGGQERGLRSGTENVGQIAKFARALESAQKNREKISQKLTKLRDYFIAKLLKLPGAKLNGPEINRLPNNINISFAGLDGEQLVLELDAGRLPAGRQVATSTGAACSIPSRNSGILDAVRFSLPLETRKRDLDYVLKMLPSILKKLNSVKNLNKIL